MAQRSSWTLRRHPVREETSRLWCGGRHLLAGLLRIGRVEMGDTAYILLLGDDSSELAAAETALAAAGYQVRAAATIAETMEAVDAAPPDAVVIAAQSAPLVLLGEAPEPSSNERSSGGHSSAAAGPVTLVETVRRRLAEARGDGSRDEPGRTPAAPTSGVRHTILSRLNSETVRIQEEERRKLSLELHDDIAQLLGNLVLMMGTCLAVAPESAGELRRYLREARETAREGFRRVQRFSIDLRPPMLDDLGLAPTILWYAERFTQETAIPAEVTMPDRLPPLDGEQETALFRIIQQALQNVRQHAEARRVDITLESEHGWVRLAVADDGVGIDQREIDQKLAEGTHLGLAGMRHRAEVLGGRLDIVSATGEGTTIVAEFPLEIGSIPETIVGPR